MKSNMISRFAIQLKKRDVTRTRTSSFHLAPTFIFKCISICFRISVGAWAAWTIPHIITTLIDMKYVMLVKFKYNSGSDEIDLQQTRGGGLFFIRRASSS